MGCIAVCSDMVQCYAGLQLDVAAHSTLQHSVSVCFLSPGIYSLYAYDVHQLSDPTAQQHAAGTSSQDSSCGVTAVNAAYFLVE